MDNKKIYIIAGERSGELHGSLLAKKLNELSTHPLTLRGIGGDQMRKNGVDTIFDIQQMSVMMLVLTSLYKIFRIYKSCTKDILEFKPDIVVLIDYGGFNLRVASFCKKNNIPVYYFIPPKMWAWAQWRVKNMHKYVEKAFVILPFEEKFFRKHDVNVQYVGHPLVEAKAQFTPNPNFIQDNQLGDKRLVVILPGSRRQELELMLEKMLKVADDFPDYQFVVAAINTLPKTLYPITKYPHVKFVFEQTYDLLHVAHAAIVGSGTATLETALFNVPQFSVYKMGWVSYQMIRIPAKKFLRESHFSLVNLIADKKVISEFFQQECKTEIMSTALDKVINDHALRQSILAEYNTILEKLGDQVPTKEVADAILERIS